ncbi:MAG: hypothetical protein ACOCV2_01290 [Persicimonas sp.]
MDSSDQHGEPHPEEVRDRTATMVRRIGYVVFMGGGLLLFIPMLIGVARGIQENEVWDPFTGDRVESDARATDCEEDARRLLREADDAASASWESSYSAWIDKCRDDHGEVYELLRDVRMDANR